MITKITTSFYFFNDDVLDIIGSPLQAIPMNNLNQLLEILKLSNYYEIEEVGTEDTNLTDYYKTKWSLHK
jgi:hypothetical protein